ncbi:hypothetical protein [Janibacter anophelis]|uniref:hypothetical protein n=1 Tax=Janibacter anophelis TaxID=319054 RepID=UPI00082A7D95|nr:hypothetical protein [Janibacter anophelis]
MRLRSRPTVVTACVATALMTLAGCGSGEGEGTDTTASSSSSNSSSASSEPTYDEAHIMTEVRKADRAFRALDPNELIPEDADWVTDSYRTKYNSDTKELKDAGLVQKGKVTTKSLHLATSEPDAPGGWQVTVYNCNVSTRRVYQDGEDVSADPLDPSKPLPEGPRESVLLDSYTTPDGGKSWQLDDVAPVEGKDSQDTPCDQ